MPTGPHTIKIISVQCVAPSTGVDGGGAEIFKGLVTTIGSAVSAIAGSTVFAGLTGATYGAATPVALAVGGWIWTAGTAASLGASVAGVAAANGIGQALPDQLYVTRDNVKIWPADKFTDIKSGDTLTVNYSMGRPKHTIEFELWEWDLVTSNDFLGKLSIPAGEVYVNTPFLIRNDEERSFYIVTVTATLDKPAVAELLPVIEQTRASEIAAAAALRDPVARDRAMAAAYAKHAAAVAEAQAA